MTVSASIKKTFEFITAAILAFGLTACATAPQTDTQVTTLRGTGTLGVIIERATGSVLVVEQRSHSILHRITGLGDLSHASVVFSPDERYAYVFGRDGGLSKVDVLTGQLVRRVIQGGNSIGGAISADGRLIAVSNYEPGGVKLFDAQSLDLVADLNSQAITGHPSKTVGMVDAPGNVFMAALLDGDEIWRIHTDSNPPQVDRYPAKGRMPYDALITPDGRYYIAGLFGEDGMSLLDLWHPEKGVQRILSEYGKGEAKLPVYKMPHLEGWTIVGDTAWVPAVGHHEVLVINTRTWTLQQRIPVYSQPVFVMGRPDGRQVWVNFAYPDNGAVQVLDTETGKILRTLEPGKTVLHMEFTAKGDEVWISVRDDNKVCVYDTTTLTQKTCLPAEKPSGIFFTWRAHRIGL
ncbi:cytochrome D1 domain-containing protein [Hahella sp. SMD15-11]|uniref:Cytochrome D1 domain-containing protein n=1 Tax=Thermohahella caldifontis TaxID=3142973 RepID=A0AB39UYM5_9GAMM